MIDRAGALLLLVPVGLLAQAPPRSRTGSWPKFELVSHVGLGQAAAGDIWVHRGFAYLGTFSCGHGVQIVDAARPATPQLLAPLITDPDSTYEDVVVIRADTPSFRGDLLAAGLQNCLFSGARGVQFWDVTNPRSPQRLGFFDTGPMTNGVHELYLFQRENRVFALLAVPGSEARGAGGDFRIVEATDPANPVQIADWGLQRHLGLSPAAVSQGGAPSAICHSAWANQAGTIAYLSHWDAGVVMLDISDPANPAFLGRTTYAPGEEGNAHSIWLAKQEKLLVVADEDFLPGAALMEITEPARLAGPVSAIEGALTVQMCGLGQSSGEVAYVGRGCNADTHSSNPAGKVALIDNGGCAFREKIVRAQGAAATGVIVAQNTAALLSAMGGSSAGVTIPGVMISRADGDRLKNALADGPLRIALANDPSHTWGFARFFDISDPTAPRQLSTFATARTRQCPAPDGVWYTVHNPFVVGDTAYFSWYSDGVRAVDISDPAKPREIAFWVPPQQPLVWGLYVQDDLVFLSDINNGLFILKRDW